MDHITDIREYDVPYHVRVAIDCKINVVSRVGPVIDLIDQLSRRVITHQGHWYRVKGHGSAKPPEIQLVEEEPDRPVIQYRRLWNFGDVCGKFQQ